MSQKHVISFIEGMDKDTSFNKYPNTRYLHAENFRFIYDEENSTGILTNDVGNKVILNLSGKLLGHTTLRNSLVLFTLRRSDNVLEIYQISEEKLDGSSLELGRDYLKLTKDFGYSTNTIIRAYGRYESESVQKVYWIDGAGLKYCNLADPDINTYDTSKFDSFPEVNYMPVQVTSNLSGSIPASMVQYAVQLYNVNGSSTLVQKSGEIIPMVPTATNSKSLKGGLPGETTLRGNTVEVSNVDTDFDRIKLYRIQYIDIAQVPEVYLIDDKPITLSSVTFSDTSSSGIQQLAYEEVAFTKTELSPNTLESKNNILFVGNVKELIFDPDI